MKMAGIPEWLRRVAMDESYRRTLLKELQTREDDREAYRCKVDPKVTCQEEADETSSRRSHSHPTPRSSSSSSSPSEQNELQRRFAFYSVQKGRLPDNILLNRYFGVSAYDRGGSMVRCDAEDGICYVNGNWVRELAGGRWWLATQVSFSFFMLL